MTLFVIAKVQSRFSSTSLSSIFHFLFFSARAFDPLRLFLSQSYAICIYIHIHLRVCELPWILQRWESYVVPPLLHFSRGTERRDIAFQCAEFQYRSRGYRGIRDFNNGVFPAITSRVAAICAIVVYSTTKSFAKRIQVGFYFLRFIKRHYTRK